LNKKDEEYQTSSLFSFVILSSILTAWPDINLLVTYSKYIGVLIVLSLCQVTYDDGFFQIDNKIYIS